MQLRMFAALSSIENAAGLDAVATRFEPLAKALTARTAVADVLHGVWLGHPVHPVLVQVPVGCWTSAAVLDAVSGRLPGTGPAADLLLAVGVAGVLPAAATGWADWAEQDTQQRRTGVVHALGNITATTLYVGSLLARRRGRRGLGKGLAYAGYATAAAAATLGGHLAYRQAAGPSHAVPAAEIAPPDWTDVGTVAELTEGTPALRRLGEVPILVLRVDGAVHAIVDRCSHASAPLHEGEVTRERGDWCVTCPWHGSVFRVRDGAVVHGPATAPQPALQVQTVGDRIQIRLPGLSMG